MHRSTRLLLCALALALLSGVASLSPTQAADSTTAIAKSYLVLVATPPGPELAASRSAPAGYKLVWADEFQTDGLPDSSKWSYDTEANASGWYNNELQYYAVARLSSSAVKGGKLRITARKERLTTAPDYGGQNYSSARLITHGKASWTYGFFDVRAKLPCGQGTWPAIWMLGTSDGPWPAKGEIDMMEQVGMYPDVINGGVHTTAAAANTLRGTTTKLSDACSAFHNYQLTWTPDAMVFGIDGKPFFTYKNPGTGEAAWPFSHPQYLLLNLAIGGDMGGTVDDRIFPAQMQVDYVRVYQKK
jgi:beta-glucanase (GH16 family)